MLKIIEKGSACIVVFEEMNFKEKKLFQQIKLLGNQENEVKYQQISFTDVETQSQKDSVLSYTERQKDAFKQVERTILSKSKEEPSAMTSSLDSELPFENPAKATEQKSQKKGKPLRFIGASIEESYKQEQRAIEQKKKLDEVQEYLDCPFLDGNDGRKLVRERFGYDAEKKRFLDELEKG